MSFFLSQSDQTELEESLGLCLRCLLAVPVCSKTDGKVIAIACVANKIHNEKLVSFLQTMKALSFFTANGAFGIIAELIPWDLYACVCIPCRFDDSDEDAIHLCFKYTATVLHSTLSVQNERKLKNQTQVSVPLNAPAFICTWCSSSLLLHRLCFRLQKTSSLI
jgi:hypothetical protein